MNDAFTSPTPIGSQGPLDVVRPGQEEAVNEPLWDTNVYAVAGQQQLTYFNVQRGGQSPTSGAIKTFDDTNLDLAGQLPNGIGYEVRAIELHLFPGAGGAGLNPAAYGAGAVAQYINDIQSVYQKGWMEFTVLNKPYLRVPLALMPPSTRNNVQAAAADASTAAINQQTRIGYAAWTGPIFKVTPFKIRPTMNFNVTLNWAAAIALPSGIAANLKVMLRGIKYRVSQ